ncbi:MAG: PTS sugar transporter subunit IIC [Erysipelotrichaceae bacterium]
MFNLENSKFFQKFVAIASKIGEQIHLSSLRDGFATLMPLFILAGLAVLVNHVIFPFFLEGETLSTVNMFGNALTNGTLNIAGLLLCPAIAYSLAKNRGFSTPFTASMVALSTLVIMMPMSVMMTPAGLEEAVSISGVLTFGNIGTTGMFAGILVGLGSTEIFTRLSGLKQLRINLGTDVPPAVGKAFSTMVPTIITLSIFAALNLFLFVVVGADLITLITNLIQAPLRGISTSLIGYLFLYSLGNMLFAFGIHQSVINGPFTEPFLLMNMNENMLAFQNGEEPMHILNSSFQAVYAQMGGTGATISLIIAIFLFSKRRSNKEIAKLAVAPGIFEINEPIIFGIPIVYNLPLMIPFVLLPVLQTLIGYFATSIGLVSILKVQIPWITPPIISGWLASAGDIRVPILQIFLIIFGVICYLPFLKISDMVAERAAAKSAEN